MKKIIVNIKDSIFLPQVLKKLGDDFKTRNIQIFVTTLQQSGITEILQNYKIEDFEYTNKTNVISVNEDFVKKYKDRDNLVTIINVNTLVEYNIPAYLLKFKLGKIEKALVEVIPLGKLKI